MKGTTFISKDSDLLGNLAGKKKLIAEAVVCQRRSSAISHFYLEDQLLRNPGAPQYESCCHSEGG